MSASIPSKCLAPVYEGWLYTPTFECGWYSHFCLQTWSENTFYEPVLFNSLQPLWWQCVAVFGPTYQWPLHLLRTLQKNLGDVCCEKGLSGLLFMTCYRCYLDKWPLNYLKDRCTFVALGDFILPRLQLDIYLLMFSF